MSEHKDYGGECYRCGGDWPCGYDRGCRDALRQAADDLEAQKPHIPPSTDPQRRTRVIQRSTLNAAIRRLRAWAEAVTDE